MSIIVKVCRKDILDCRIEKIQPIISPEKMLEMLPATNTVYKHIATSRTDISNIINRKDDRFLVIAGPCSIHDTAAAFDYAKRLSVLRKKFKDFFYIVMRVYFEKPRTALGWRGLIVEPKLNGNIDIIEGLKTARNLLLQIAGLGLPSAVEVLDPVVPQYIGDLISWASIGARSAESQLHRELASGLSMPIGFKNMTDGEILPAVNGIIASRTPHAFLGPASDGSSAVIHTSGNKDTHLILRGGGEYPNYNSASVFDALRLLNSNGLAPNLLIDCSHGNSRRRPDRQPHILFNSLKLRFESASYFKGIRGCMLESFIQEGKTKIKSCFDPSEYGKSITDPCLGWEDTEETLSQAYKEFSPLLKKQKLQIEDIYQNLENETENKSKMPEIIIYTDGSCSGNPGPGGWAFVVAQAGGSKENELYRQSGYEKYTTNNRMEMTAVIEALNKINREIETASITPSKIHIYTDSKYVQQGMTMWLKSWKINNWRTSDRKPVKNQDLWSRLDKLASVLKPEWHWIKGHAGNSFNEICDSLAVAAAAKARKS